MKHLMIFVAAVVVLAGCKPKQERVSDQSDPGRIERTSIRVESAQCGMCASAIEEALQALEGVKKAEVDLDRKQANVEFLPAKADLARLETAITKAGYDANDKKADPAAYEKLDECCKVK